MLVGSCSCLFGAVLVADDAAISFTGDGDSSLAPFTVDGPWTLEWSSRTEFTTLARLEIRLFDDVSGEFLGKVADRKGAGRGHKLFDNAGRFRLVVVAASLEWEITVQEVDDEQAARIKRQSEGRPSMLDTTRRVSSRVPEDSFETWSTEGDDTLLLFGDGYIRWRISFSPPDCPGLDDAQAISFVSAGRGSDAGYDSIMLDDGTRCYFSSAIPGLAR